MGVMDRPLTIPNASRESPQPFHAFLQQAMSGILALLFAWRILIFSTRDRDRESAITDSSTETSPQTPPSPAVAFLSSTSATTTTTTSSLLDSLNEERAAAHRTAALLPLLLRQPCVPATIAEEESESLSSAEEKSPHFTNSAEADAQLKSDDVHPEDASRFVTDFIDIDKERHRENVEEVGGITTLIQPALNRAYIVQKGDERRRHHHLRRTFSSESDRLERNNSQGRSILDEERGPYSDEVRSILAKVAGRMTHAPNSLVMEQEQIDTDREQEEELVFGEGQQKRLTMDDTASLNSVSLSLNTTKDNVLDVSLTSNPTVDEKSAVESTMLKDVGRPSVRPPSPPHDLPPPPPELAAATRTSTPLSTSSSHRNEVKDQYQYVGTSKSAALVPTQNLNRVADLPELAPPKVTPPPPPPPPPPTFSPAMNALGRMHFSTHDRLGKGMSSSLSTDLPPAPPPPPPPPPPPVSTSAGTKSGCSSREDLLSEQAPSRATVREIPVLRTTSSTVPSSHHLLEYKMPSISSYHHGDVQDEYYRREIMTRTVITRSTEALSQQPPLGRSSPIEGYITHPDPGTREERTVDYKVKYHRDIEEQERRIREQQERRRKEEEERRKRDEENRRVWEMRELEILERLRMDRERKQKVLENSVYERERLEKERIERDRLEREKAEMLRRAEWERMENERRGLEEEELARKRLLETERLERERAEAERLERLRLEREREQMERERLEEERREQERLEMERVERERIERERIEIERIERIKRERVEREQREREKEREEQERLRLEREELERLERERRELEIRERELAEIQRKEAIEREKQRLADEAREARRREEERREAELLADIKRQADERERLRKLQEREEKERLERIRREQQRVEMERAEAERREKERLEDERREKELLEAQLRQKEQRERERLADIERETRLQEEEMREKARRDAERRAAAERERKRREDEEKERLNLYELERAAASRKLQRQVDLEREREREELDRKAFEIAEMERKANERREIERLEEERSLAELREKERRNQEIRERERREMEERAAARQREDRRSRDKLDHIMRERTEKERFEAEKRRLLAEKEAMSKKRQYLTSSETLQKLTRPLYLSRENLSNPEYTTKVERQVIERVDRNVWVDDVRIPSQQTVSYSLDSTNEENIRDRVYNPNDLARNGSTRTSRYRAKMEKARREFIAGGSESSDPVAERFRRSQDDIVQRSRPEYRGPLLQKFHDSEFKSKTDLDGVSYPRVGPSPYGQEFERLLEETERKYAAYRMRMSQPNLYSRSRNWSTSYLETDVDTGRPEFAATTREVEETNLDDVHHRSGSVVDYQRQSRRDQTEENVDTAHSRSRSADYLMDKRTREETIPPENELQKSLGDSMRTSHISDHEMRFRKSTEKLTVPEWYRESRTTARPTDVDLTLPRSHHHHQQHSEISSRPTPTDQQHHQQQHQQQYQQQQQQQQYQMQRSSEPYHSSVGYRKAQTPSANVGGVDFPKGMFDRYKDEIEDLRRSRSSLHQIAQEHRQEVKPTATPRRSLSQEVISSSHGAGSPQVNGSSPRALPGYTVSSVPTGWNFGEQTRSRHSRVVEVADTFAGAKPSEEEQGDVAQRYGGRVTIEEVLDSIFKRSPGASAHATDTSLPLHDDEQQAKNGNGPGIYSKNYMLMEQVMKRPSKAESLLKSELLFVRCSFCHKTRELSAARMQYVSCKHCYSYYCTRNCRLRDWPKHSLGCSFARINTLCKDVIMKVREDPEAQACMSRVARNGYSTSGRGSVNIRLSSPQLAQCHRSLLELLDTGMPSIVVGLANIITGGSTLVGGAYVTHGWSALSAIPQQQLLHYYTIAALLQECKEPSLIALCRRYDPREKFILSVSIIADIEYCPQTPPPEIAEWTQHPPKDVFQPTSVGSPLNPSSFYGPMVLVPTDV